MVLIERSSKNVAKKISCKLIFRRRATLYPLSQPAIIEADPGLEPGTFALHRDQSQKIFTATGNRTPGERLEVFHVTTTPLLYVLMNN
jgi:hypothetical protein